MTAPISDLCDHLSIDVQQPHVTRRALACALVSIRSAGATPAEADALLDLYVQLPKAVIA